MVPPLGVDIGEILAASLCHETSLSRIPCACRMALWKNYIVLFGGFHDIGVRSKTRAAHAP